MGILRLIMAYRKVLVGMLIVPISLNGCNAQETINPPSELTLVGNIDPASTSKLLAESRGPAKKLVVTSMGGEIESAITIGKLVRDKGLAVVVRGYCLSACAHFIFMSALEKSVEEYSIVGFHGTASARLELFKLAGRNDLAMDYSNLATLERSFYRDIGISDALLIDPLIKVSPVCYLVGTTSRPLPSGKSGLMTRTSFYIPTKQELGRFGSSRITGFWPTTPTELMAAASRLPQSARLTFRLEGSEQASAGQLPSVEECPVSFP